MASTAITPQTLEPDTFARKVIEDRLRVEGPIRGYLYAQKEGMKDDELYRTYASKKWIYQARRVATQANAGGGSVRADISVATGQVARLITSHVVNSGTNGLNLWKRDEDAANAVYLGSVASAAATNASLPNLGTSTASANVAFSHGMLISPGQTLSFDQTVAGAQNDTITIAIELELYNLPTLPTWSVARSTNAADVTLADSTISEANTLQELPC